MYMVCKIPEYGFNPEAVGADFESLDEACGAGTNEMDFTAEDYLSAIDDIVGLLESFVGLSIPADEVDDICEVCS